MGRTAERSLDTAGSNPSRPASPSQDARTLIDRQGGPERPELLRVWRRKEWLFRMTDGRAIFLHIENCTDGKK